MTPLFRKFLGLNWVIFANIIILITFGVYAIYNAADGRPGFEKQWSDQVIWTCIGLVGFFVASLIDYKWLRFVAWPMYIVALGGVILVKYIGTDNDVGARSWIRFGGLSIQPSQLMILAGIAVLAIVFGDLQRWARVFRSPALRIVLGGILTVVPMVLILKEPDLGSAAVWGPMFCGMLLVGSIPFRYLIALVLLVLTVLPLAYSFGLKEYQQNRIIVFRKMLLNEPLTREDLRGDAWTQNYLQIAVGSGGMEGKGPLSRKVLNQKSIHRTFFPHEAINDFISGVICEEFGFRGMLLLISAFSMLMFQCIFVAFYARDQMGRLLVVGVVATMMTYIFMNIGMNLLMVPITGLPLPFISYGGTFMIVVLFMFGIVQSVWVHRNISPTQPMPEDSRSLAKEE
ncbi:MAG: FtsW/RodA/SpoVE family cell cycle protein [Verrucomicrobiaceae bacterium]|nr:FtsW/RodA/SpoVE family cell cycle protein [Verrucomicrobiaceae bacterium]